MSNSPFPKRTKSQATAEIGMTIVAGIVREHLGWEFRRTPQEADFGIDGYIDVITKEGYVTGKSFAVQIKTGPSYLVESPRGAWRYRGDVKHVNYYANLDVPVLLILVDPSSRTAWWQIFNAYEIDRTEGGWTIAVPHSKQFERNCREELFKLVGPATDYLPHLEHFWTLGESAKDYGIICLQVQRFEIERGLFRPFQRILERLTASREAVLGARNKLEVLIDGYNEDSRELFQIPEVRRWVTSMVETSKYLAYFLYLGSEAQAINLIIACICEAEVVGQEKNPEQVGKVGLRLKAPERIGAFMNQQYAQLNELTERFGLSEETNHAISVEFADKIQRFGKVSG